MIELPQVPEEKRKILEQLVAQLSRVHGMAAISLGGSYASALSMFPRMLILGCIIMNATYSPLQRYGRLQDVLQQKSRQK